jgi:hypothetical protein
MRALKTAASLRHLPLLALALLASPASAQTRSSFPDSVLARVDGEAVTQRQLLIAAARMGTAPDSITPEQRREVLDLLIEQRALARAARRAALPWSGSDSGSVESLADRLTLNAALDSALRAHRAGLEAAGRPVPGEQEIGTSLRDSTVSRWAPRWDEARLTTLLAAWVALPRPTAQMSIQEQLRIAGLLPVIAPGDSAAPVLTSAVGTLTGADLLEEWRRLNPIYRPRVETVDQLRDVARNALLERELRQRAATQRLRERADIAAALEERREYLAVQHFVQREVYDDLLPDSTVLIVHFERTRAKWRLAPHARVLQFDLATRDQAQQLRLRLMQAADAETLVVRGNRQGRDFVRMVSAEYDSSVYRLALRAGPGAVVGPDSLAQGWRVLRVMAVVDARDRTWPEARTFVTREWTELEAERRMRRLLDTLLAAARVERAPAPRAPRVSTRTPR